MAKEVIDLKKKIRQYKYDMALLQKIDCTKEETKQFRQLLKEKQPLPDGVYQYKSDMGENIDSFYRIHTPDLTEGEITEYLTYKQLDLLKTIKGYLTFFVILTVVSLIGGFLISLGAFR